MENATPNTLPWYHTRKFWGVVFSALVAWGIGYYLLEVYRLEFSSFRTFTGLSISLGALSVGTFLFKLVGEIVSVIIFYIIMTSLSYMTFHKKRVVVIWPILFVIIFLVGHVLGIFYLGYFG